MSEKINGKRKCSKCDTWYKWEPNKPYCNNCMKEYRKQYYKKNKARLNKNRSNATPNYYNKNLIERELKGLEPISGGVFRGLTPEQSEALKTGNVELLLKT